MDRDADAAVPLDRLGDDADCRIVASDPPLPPDAAAALAAAIAKLFAQFAREGRCRAHACASVLDGAAVVIAWQGDAALSGCSHDKLAKLLAAHERDGRRLLAPPPLSVIDRAGTVRCLDRAGVRAGLVAGMLDGECQVIDRAVVRLGDWRGRGLVPLRAHALGRVLGVAGS